MEPVGAFIASIISGLIANYISNSLEKKNNFNIKQIPLEIHKKLEYDENDMESVRQYNRENLKNKFENFVFFVFSYMIIGASLYVPLVLYSGIGKKYINFANTKLSYDYVLQKDDFMLASIIFAFIFYLPILYISNKIVQVTSVKLREYIKITNSKIIALRVLIIFFIAVFIAGNIYYVLSPTIAWWDAIKFTLTVVFFLVAMGANSQ